MANPLSCDELNVQLKQGQITASDLADRALDRALQSPSTFLHLAIDASRSEAQRADDRRRRGELGGPLDGIPIAWKDLFDVAGTRTTAGSACLAAATEASDDAPCVAALRRAISFRPALL